jgi:hypothetical protein
MSGGEVVFEPDEPDWWDDENVGDSAEAEGNENEDGNETVI